MSPSLRRWSLVVIVGIALLLIPILGYASQGNPVIDGSDVGLHAASIDAIASLSDRSLLLSFNRSQRVPGIPTMIAPADLVRFVPLSLGETTAGSYSVLVRGSTVGLRARDADINGVQLLPDGRLLVTLRSAATRVAGIAETVDNHDIIAFTPGAPGNYGAGTWAMYFDGSDVGLTTKDEGLDGFTVDVDGRLYLSTAGTFKVAGVSGA